MDHRRLLATGYRCEHGSLPRHGVLKAQALGSGVVGEPSGVGRLSIARHARVEARVERSTSLE